MARFATVAIALVCAARASAFVPSGARPARPSALNSFSGFENLIETIFNPEPRGASIMSNSAAPTSAPRLTARRPSTTAPAFRETEIVAPRAADFAAPAPAPALGGLDDLAPLMLSDTKNNVLKFEHRIDTTPL